MSRQYDELKAGLCRGWNTWSAQSVTSHVLLPQGFAVNLGFKEYRTGRCLKSPLIGRQGAEDERLRPGPHAYDGGYTKLTMSWAGIELEVESAHAGEDLVILVRALANPGLKAPSLVVEAALLWNRPGSYRREGSALLCDMPGSSVAVFAATPLVEDCWTLSSGPYLALPIAPVAALGTGSPRGAEEIAGIIELERAAHARKAGAYGDCAEIYRAIQTSMAWDSVYEPSKDRVVSPVSRIWSCASGGFALFAWDNYFAGYLAGLDCREIAYANVVEITRERTRAGFVPNYANGTGFFTEDRSQPPVGSWVVRELYRRYGDRWLLEEVFEELLAWNRWWPGHRDTDGLLCWGSEPYEPRVGNPWESDGVNGRYGAALESGLDNSPMYDDVPFDAERHQLRLADAGLLGLYLMDCEALADIARLLGREPEEAELREREARYRAACARLWDEGFGLYLNLRLDTGERSRRISPTNFYPMIAGVPSPAQAERMVREHLLDPAEFWGEWILPSIARNDPAYPDQDYWRGRIWAPMNFLVYLGLRRYGFGALREDFAAKSAALLLKEWTREGHVHENYNGDTGEGCDKANSDRFYHWGGLLGLIQLIERGFLAPPEAPLP